MHLMADMLLGAFSVYVNLIGISNQKPISVFYNTHFNGIFVFIMGKYKMFTKYEYKCKIKRENIKGGGILETRSINLFFMGNEGNL